MNADKLETIRKVAPIGHTIRFKCRKPGLPNVMQADVTGMAADLGVTVDMPGVRFVRIEDIYESFKVKQDEKILQEAVAKALQRNLHH